MAKVIHAERRIPANRLPHGAGDLGEQSQGLVRDFDAWAGAGGLVPMGHRVLVLGGTADEQARCIDKDARCEVELDEGKAHFPAAQHPLRIALGCGSFWRGCVGVHAHLVTILAAQELPAGHAIDLTHQVPQRNLQTGDAAALTTPVSKGLDGAEDHVYVAGVLAQEHAFELQRVLLVPRIAHLAQAINALVGIQADDGVIVVGGHDRDAHVRDFELGWPGIGIDGVLHLSHLLFGLFFRNHVISLSL